MPTSDLITGQDGTTTAAVACCVCGGGDRCLDTTWRRTVGSLSFTCDNFTTTDCGTSVPYVVDRVLPRPNVSCLSTRDVPESKHAKQTCIGAHSDSLVVSSQSFVFQERSVVYLTTVVLSRQALRAACAGVEPTSAAKRPLRKPQPDQARLCGTCHIVICFGSLLGVSFVCVCVCVLSHWVHAAMDDAPDLPSLECSSHWSLGLFPASVESLFVPIDSAFDVMIKSAYECIADSHCTTPCRCHSRIFTAAVLLPRLRKDQRHARQRQCCPAQPLREAHQRQPSH
jgi:hypothetical protein